MFENLMDPAVLCFVFGVIAGLAGTDIRLPEALYESISVYLLLAIGIKGGTDLARVGFSSAGPSIVAALAMGAIMPLVAYPVLRRPIGLDRSNAAAVAAHYGSVSAVTYAVCLAFLDSKGVRYESFTAVLLAFMEFPALAVGILLARKGTGRDVSLTETLREIFLGKGVYFLLVGLLVAYLATPKKLSALEPFFHAPFKGVLALFLLEMGLVASRRVADLARLGPSLMGFGIVMPLVGGGLGAIVGTALGLSVGGTAVLATLAASASYIAAPAAMRLAVPEANPAIYLTASLGVTFPFNILWGIPMYLWMAATVHAWMG